MYYRATVIKINMVLVQNHTHRAIEKIKTSTSL